MAAGLTCGRSAVCLHGEFRMRDALAEFGVLRTSRLCVHSCMYVQGRLLPRRTHTMTHGRILLPRPTILRFGIKTKPSGF